LAAWGIIALLIAVFPANVVPLPASGYSTGTADHSFAAASIAGRFHSVGVLAYETGRDKIMNLKLIIHEILEDYALPIHGDHGVAHWARVLENGLKLARSNWSQRDGRFTCSQSFMIPRRINECTDADHGLRGADFAAELRGQLFDISDHDFNLLYRACEGHTHERTHPDITIQTCWDSDRLDLGRVGITPHPSKLCTDAAKTKEMIQWADGRASFRVVPALVLDDWGIELPKERIW
jgi:uncharacterized protein